MTRARRPFLWASVVGVCAGTIVASVWIAYRVDDGPRVKKPTGYVLPPARIGTASGDFDGDGLSDRLRIDPVKGEVVATLGNGTTLRSDWLATDNGDVLGTADIAGDGRKQVVVKTGGNTWSVGAIVAVRGRSIVVNDLRFDEHTIGWDNHSNCCPGGSAGVVCMTVQGQRALVITQSEVLPKGYSAEGTPYDLLRSLPRDQLERRWSREVYRLEGAKLVAWSQDSGAIGVDDPNPPEVPLGNQMDCGSALDPR